MKSLVFLEHHNDEIRTGSLSLLAKAASIGGGSASAVIVGAGIPQEMATHAGRFGATKVYLASDDAFGAPLPQPRVDVMADLIRSGGYDTVLFSNSVLAADIAGGLSARLDAGVNWDLVDLDEHGDELVGSRLALGDSVLVKVGWRSEPRLALIRPGSFNPVERSGKTEVVAWTTQLQAHSTLASIVEQRIALEEGPSLESAEVIVAGGLGLGSKENFSLAEELAQVLGGVVGATRAAVYAGWYPHSAQVGQTGKTVAPQLYVALGVSGAVQHKVGMQRSKTIVSINLDSMAPIFEISDLGVVGDVHSVVPELIELLRHRGGS